MHYYNEEDIKISDILKIGFVLCIFILLILVNYHYTFILCEYLNIPFNLELSMISLGFGYELTFLSAIFETSILCFCILKLLNNIKK